MRELFFVAMSIIGTVGCFWAAIVKFDEQTSSSTKVIADYTALQKEGVALLQKIRDRLAAQKTNQGHTPS